MQNPVSLVKVGYRMVQALRHPERLQDILALADVLAPPRSMRRLADALWRIPSAAAALRERPRVGAIDLAALRLLPPGTLGRAFAEHLDSHGLELSALPRREARTDTEYIRAHLLEVHDIWHVLTGFGTEVEDELGLMAFNLAQLGSPFAAGILTGGLANTLLYAFPERDVRMRAILRGWLLGKRSRLLFGTPWARLWESPLEALRTRFELDVRAVDGLLPAVQAPATLAAPPAQSW
jgi:ubiquinone biosynthesis protein Coq4